MIVDITARHGTVGEPLREHAREKLEHALRRRDDIVSAHVILDVEKTRHVAEMIVYGRHLTATVHADADDLHAAIDRCAEKLRHHLDHHHGRQRERRRRSLALAEAEVAALAQASRMAETEAPEDRRSVPEEQEPAVVRTRAQQPKAMTVKEAAHELEESRRPFLVFRDAESQQVHLLYKREDGRLGLLEGVA